MIVFIFVPWAGLFCYVVSSIVTLSRTLCAIELIILRFVFYILIVFARLRWFW